MDNNDADHPVLTNELKSVKIDVQFSLGSYSLQSAFLKMQDLSPPNIAPPTPTIPVFNYTREQNEFESVNVYYHIQNFAKHVVSLGFDNLLIDQILVDGNGLNGQDQSIFTPSNPPRINFGEGGVDDAEDADVVVHEYGHYLSNAAAPNTNDGFERLGLDEGLCDFFAASYSKSIKDFRWYDIFTWDGHNEFWAGRSANVSKKYPEDINSGSIHSNGEMLSTAMMLVQEKIGREKSEMLMIQSIYSYYKNMGMQDAGNLVLQADSILFSGAHYCEIFAVLDQFGLCDPELISGCLRKDNQLAMPVLSNKNICPGDSVLLMNEMELNPDYTYTWSPDYNLIYQNQPVPTVFPDSTIEYELNVQTDDGRFNTKPVKVIVESCALEIFNTAAFASGSGSLIVHLPERQSLRPQWIRLIDLSGKVIQKWDIDSGSATWEINSRGVAPGVYILQLRRNNGKYVSEKLLKLE